MKRRANASLFPPLEWIRQGSLFSHFILWCTKGLESLWLFPSDGPVMQRLRHSTAFSESRLNSSSVHLYVFSTIIRPSSSAPKLNLYETFFLFSLPEPHGISNQWRKSTRNQQTLGEAIASEGSWRGRRPELQPSQLLHPPGPSLLWKREEFALKVSSSEREK